MLYEPIEFCILGNPPECSTHEVSSRDSPFNKLCGPPLAQASKPCVFPATIDQISECLLSLPVLQRADCRLMQMASRLQIAGGRREFADIKKWVVLGRGFTNDMAETSHSGRINLCMSIAANCT